MATNMIRMVFAVAITLVAYAPASTEAAKAVGPVYEVMSGYSNTCSTGFKPITNCNDCKAAQAEYWNDAKERFVGQGSYNSFPSGCYASKDSGQGRLEFKCNTHSTGAPSVYFEKVCKNESVVTPEPTTNPSPGPTTNPSPGPTTTNPTSSPTTTNPTFSPTLGPVSVAAAAFDEVVDYFASVGPDHCYTNTSAAKLDIKKLKSKFESYRMERLKMDRTALAQVDKKELMDRFKGRQKVFAATKRDLRTKKRAAKLGGKSCRMD